MTHHGNCAHDHGHAHDCGHAHARGHADGNAHGGSVGVMERAGNWFAASPAGPLIAAAGAVCG
ncbi:hypothetical protein ACEE18_11740, partial [Corynebacterium freneyi]